MPLYIRDDRVLDEVERDAQAERRLDAALERLDALPRRQVTSDRDLYDENGNPIL